MLGGLGLWVGIGFGFAGGAFVAWCCEKAVRSYLVDALREREQCIATLHRASDELYDLNTQQHAELQRLHGLLNACEQERVRLGMRLVHLAAHEEAR